MYLSSPTLDDLLRRVLERLLKSNNHIQPTKFGATELTGTLLKITNPRARLSRTESKGTVFSPSYSRRWRRRRADFPLMVGCAVAHCVCFAAASGLGVGAGSSRGWIAGAMVAPSFMALSASTPPRCGGSTRPLGRQQQRRGGRGKPSRQPARRASRAAGEWC